jgi:methylmalonyl-CoA/ethylmalonyl-CoA epimerase
MSASRAFVERLLAAAPADPVLLPPGVEAGAVVIAARAAGATTARLAGPASKAALLDTLSQELRLPAWFGRNWDALEELLGSPEPALAGPVVIVWNEPAALTAADPAAWATARDVLRSAAAARRARSDGPLVVLLAGEVPADADAGARLARDAPHDHDVSPITLGGAPVTPAVPPHIRSVGRVHHVAVVVRSLDAALGFYRDTLGLSPGPVVAIPSDRVKIAFLPVGEVKIELVEPTDDSTGVARFLESRGEGFHHVCFEVPDVSAALTRLGLDGVGLIDTTPRPGAEGPVAFLHPKSCHGVLVELIEARGGPAWTSLYPHGFRAPGS